MRVYAVCTCTCWCLKINSIFLLQVYQLYIHAYVILLLLQLGVDYHHNVCVAHYKSLLKAKVDTAMEHCGGVHFISCMRKVLSKVNTFLQIDLCIAWAELNEGPIRGKIGLSLSMNPISLFLSLSLLILAGMFDLGQFRRENKSGISVSLVGIIHILSPLNHMCVCVCAVVCGSKSSPRVKRTLGQKQNWKNDLNEAPPRRSITSAGLGSP